MQILVHASVAGKSPAHQFDFMGSTHSAGIGAVLVVFLHAGIPYMTKPLPFLVWPATDPIRQRPSMD